MTLSPPKSLLQDYQNDEQRVLQKSKSLKTVVAWCLYDWAISAFSVIVVTFIFATYFTKSVAENEIIGTYQWANATSLAGLIIAILSPIFGAIADFRGYHKRWLIFFTMVCIISCSLLWYAYPNTQSVTLILTCVVFGTIGYEIATVFYNAFLNHIADSRYLGRISGWGWGAGYFGGIISLTITLFLFLKSGWFDTKTAEQIRICGPFVAIWIFLFSLPLFIFSPNISRKHCSMQQSIFAGFKELLKTLRKLPKDRNIFIFLLAHMIYADGLNTLFAFGGIYAAGSYGFSFEEVLLFGISMNVAAGLGAFSLAWVDDYIGPKKTILLSLVFLTMLGCVLLFLQEKKAFWLIALFLGLFVGPVQSASRTLMVKLIKDKETMGEMFGLYALSGRVTAFIGPWLFGMMTVMFQTQRAGMASVLVFFAVGGFMLLPVKSVKSL